MAAIVVLEGSVKVNRDDSTATTEEDSVEWSGEWHFAKDKRTHLHFKYKHVKANVAVARDLFDYVCFLDPLPKPCVEAGSTSTISDDAPKSVEGDNPPPLLEEADSLSDSVKEVSKPKTEENILEVEIALPPEAEAEAVAVAVGDIIAPIAPSQVALPTIPVPDTATPPLPLPTAARTSSASKKKGGSSKDNPSGTTGSRGRGRPPLSSQSGGGSVTSTSSSGGAVAGSGGASSSSSSNAAGKQAAADSSESTKQQQQHPTAATRFSTSRDPVPVPGAHPLLGVWEGYFKIKPAKEEESVVEMFFFYSVVGDAVGYHLEEKDIPIDFKDLPLDPTFPTSVARRAEVFQFGGAAALSEGGESSEGAMESSSSSSSSYMGGSSSAYMQTLGHRLPPHPTTHTHSQANALPRSPTAVLLYGFGRNALGRFSVAAVYDEASGSLKCEKKYMLTKFSARRGRRSLAEHAQQSTGPGSAVSVTSIGSGSGGLHSSGFGVAGSGSDHGGVPVMIPMTRQRSAPSLYSSYISAIGEDDADVAQSTYKRRRSGESGSGSGMADSSNNSNTGGGAGVGWHSSDHSEAWSSGLGDSAGGYGGPSTQLICNRNPDEDSPDNLFREAFQDCETGEIYEGEVAYGTYRHGKGIVLYCDGLLYDGTFVMGKEHGKGQLKTADGRIIYDGDWMDGFIHGVGTYNFGDGGRYSGDWREGSRHGRGEYIFPNGCSYSGDWRENKRSGKGTFAWADGSYYYGEWDGDCRSGRGLLELKNGFIYDGLWSSNLMEGKGTTTHPGGQVYQGTYKNGLREGRGSVHFAEGAIYEGRFKEDRFDGQGTIKVVGVVPGQERGEYFIPVQIQSELWRIHQKAGFGGDPH